MHTAPSRRSDYPIVWICWSAWGLCRLEAQGQTANHAFGRTDDEQLVVNRLIARGVVEEVADRDQHFPLRRAEVEKRQRLPDLHVKASRDTGLRGHVAARKAVAHPVEHHH